MLSRGTLGVCAVAGALFVGYCVYFDKKRRNDPMFKKKLREKRRRAAKNSAQFEWPDLKDQEAIQKFFFEQVQIGEEMLSRGEVKEGVQHLARAVAICGQPQQLLQVLQQTLPPQVFGLLLSTLKTTGNEIAARAAAPVERSSTVQISEEDLE